MEKPDTLSRQDIIRSLIEEEDLQTAQMDKRLQKLQLWNQRPILVKKMFKAKGSEFVRKPTRTIVRDEVVINSS